MTVSDALANPRRDTGRIVLPPASYAHEQEKVRERWPAAVEFVKQRKLNEVFDGELEDIGVILQGYVQRGYTGLIENGFGGCLAKAAYRCM